MNCMLSMKRASHDAVMFSTRGRVSPESASEEKSPCHLTVTVLFFPSCLPGFSTSGVTEEKDSCLWIINPTLKHPLFLEFCIASVVIWHSVKKKEKKRKERIKTKQSLWAKCQNPYSHSIPCLFIKNVQEREERERKMLWISAPHSFLWTLWLEWLESQELPSSKFAVHILGDLKVSIKYAW